MNVRLHILQTQYDAMKDRPDADRRILNRYERLIAAETSKNQPADPVSAQAPAGAQARTY